MQAGAGDEITLRWNREAWQKIILYPRVLKDVSKIDTRISLFDEESPHPIILAPTSAHKLIHYEGELATARGACEAEAIMIVSTGATTTIEEISKVAKGRLWFQLYVQKDHGFTLELVNRAKASACKALCITVDNPVSGARNRIQRVGFELPPNIQQPMDPHGYRKMQSLATTSESRKPTTWKDIEWIQSKTSMPVLLKGILHPDDAEKAMASGVNGIIVSNHGARNLDTTPATIDALPRIIDKVKGQLPVLVDGGIRRGTDILKALAYGATAILIGRPYLYGLGVDGADGVKSIIEILRKEFEMAMALTGCTSRADINESLIFQKPC